MMKNSDNLFNRAYKNMIIEDAKIKLAYIKDNYNINLKLSVEESKPIKVIIKTNKIDFLANYIQTKSNINLTEWEEFIFENDYIFVNSKTYQHDFSGHAKNCIMFIYNNLSIINFNRKDVSISTLREIGHFVSIMIVIKNLKNSDGTVPNSVSAKIKEMLDAGKKR